jgi:hypothetical protein
VLDEADAGRRVAQGGAALGAGDLVDPGGHLGPARQVGAHENDPAARRGRQEAEADGGAGEEADAPHLGGAGDGPLVAVGKPSHVRSTSAGEGRRG